MANKKQTKAKTLEAIEAEKREPAPNLIFVGHKQKREPVSFFTDGTEKINLPAKSEQISDDGTAKPFYHKQAARVVRTMGSRLYKFYDAGQQAESEPAPAAAPEALTVTAAEAETEANAEKK